MKKMTEQIEMQILEKLASLRLSQGMTKQALADKAGITRSYITLLEQKKRHPTLDVCLRITQALNCSLWKLIRDAEKSLPNND